MTRPLDRLAAPRAGGTVQALRWAALAVVAAITLPACSPTSSPAVQTPDTSVSASPGPTAPAPASPRPTTVLLSLLPGDPPDDPATLTAAPASATDDADAAAPGADDALTTGATTTTEPDADTGLHLTAVLTAPGEAAVLLRLSLDPASTTGPGSVQVEADGSAALVSAGGDLVVGLATPLVLDADGARLRASWSAPAASDDGSSGLTVDLLLDDDAAATSPLTVTAHLGTAVVAKTDWGVREGGESLAVTPTDWGRAGGRSADAHAWAELVRREPAAESDVMDKQLRCHLLGARDKATWNLEPWRPDVPYLDYLAARCNPT